MKDRDKQLIDSVLDLVSEFSENEFEKLIATISLGFSLLVSGSKAIGYSIEKIKEILDEGWEEKNHE